MADIIEDIKMRLSIEQVVGQYVQLKKAGQNYKGLCPFHNEKTPSFVVSPEKQIAWCFGCQKGGDIFNFIKEVENIEFAEAINVLAEMASLDVSQYRNSSPQNKQSKSEKTAMVDAHEEAAKFFEARLRDTDEGKAALEYVLKRGITEEMIKKFRIGWAPESFQDLYKYLLEKGFTKEILLKGGLVTAKDTGGEKIYDRFHGRIIFPIEDNLGRVVAFAGRASRDGQEPKYLNSAETAIYNKRNILYGYSLNKKAIKNEGRAIVVEGYFDVIASVQVGVENVVATSGTALTTQQIQLLKRLTKNVVFAFDSDKAGIDAAYRGVEVAQPLDVNVLVTAVGGGKDAADLVKDHPEKWGMVIDAAIPYIEFFVRYYNKNLSEDTPNRSQVILDKVFPLMKKMKKKVELDRAVQFVASTFHVKPQFVYDDLQNLKSSTIQNLRHAKNDKSPLNPLSLNDGEHLFALIMTYPETLKQFRGDVEKISVPDSLQNIYNCFLKHYNPTRLEFDKDSFCANLSQEEKQQVDVMTLYVENKYKEFSFDNISSEVASFITRINKAKTSQERDRLQQSLADAEKKGDMAEVSKILQEIQKTY